MAPYSNQTFSNTGWNMAGIQHAVNVNCHPCQHSAVNTQSLFQVFVLKKLLAAEHPPPLLSPQHSANHSGQGSVARTQQRPIHRGGWINAAVVDMLSGDVFAGWL
jgi:hypothetical protein